MVSVRTDFVFGLSAFWHGLRPGYYLTFFSAAPMMKVQQKIGNLTFKARETSHLYEVVIYFTFYFNKLMGKGGGCSGLRFSKTLFEIF